MVQQYNFTELLELLGNENPDAAQKTIEEFDQVILIEFLQTATLDNRKNFIEKYLSYCPEILPELDNDIISEAIELLGEKKFASIIRNLPAEEIVDILEDLGEKEIKSILPSLPARISIVLNEILSYPEESAGRLIHKDFMVIPQDWSVEQVLQLIRSYKQPHKDSSEIFVIDEESKPVGSIKLIELLRVSRKLMIKDIMETDIKTVEAGTDQEDVANLFQDYFLLSIAVVDAEGKIIGVISLDDVVSVISEEAEEDILHVGKVSENDIRANIATTMFRRLKWLIITFISINCSSYIIGFFEKALNSHVELAILMPVVAAMGGNAGIQASTISVRAIISKQLTEANALRLFRKELLVGFFNGLIMSCLMAIIIALRFHNIRLEITFFCAVTSVFTLATSIGSAIPFIVEKLGGDSALSSSIITSSFTDLLAFVVLLSTATLILL